MNLREEFEKEVNSLNITNVDKLFRTGATEYINWLENRITKKEIDLNSGEKINLPQIHLSAIDGKTKEEATEIVVHKLADGSISIEWFPSEIIQKALNCNQFMATFNREARCKLIEFITSDVTYAS